MNNKKHFTLIEIIVSITILSILLSIILIRVSDLKNKAIYSSVSSNISIIQTATDSYYLKKERYPVKEQSNLNLSNPQLIDIDTLVEEGYLKKKLDKSKVKNQYYWVDVFGRVWGATNKEVSSINLVKKKEGSKSLEFAINEKFSGFDIYEVNGYNSLASSSPISGLTADLNQSNSKSYKIIDSITYKGNTTELVNLDLPNEHASYLVSMTDEYGLNLPPMGKFNGSKNHSFKGDGIYQFEIEGEEDMYWIDFLTLEDKKGNSTIDYRFKVKSKNGDFLPWTEDFFSLPESKHIVVEIEIKSDSDGNTATIYDVQVMFKYKDEEILEPIQTPNCEMDCYAENITCPNPTVNSDFTYQNGGNYIIPFYINGVSSIENTYIKKPNFSSSSYKIKNIQYYIYLEGQYQLVTDLNEIFKNNCAFAIYDMEIVRVITSNTIESKVCGSGASKNKYYGDIQRFVYSYYLEAEVQIKSLDIKTSQPNLLNVYIEQSTNGESFEIVDSILDIKTPSCINIVYEFEGKPHGSANIIPPLLKACEDCEPVDKCAKNCISTGPACIFNCNEKTDDDSSCTGTDCKPKPEFCKTEYDECDTPPCLEKCEPVKKEEAWVTLESIRFFGNGPINKDTHWTEVVTTEEVYDKENTRIVYNYAKKINNISWSGLYEDFRKTGKAQAVMAVAFIQVRKTELNNIDSANYPIVKSIVFKSEEGDLPASMTNPSLIITPKKDNNKDSDVFSNASKITWEAEVSDPRNLKITNIEWGGEVREQYPVGFYTIKARATNERGYTSDWVSYRLEVIEEKPVANFIVEGEPKYIAIGEKVPFKTYLSYDPDGDGIVNVEWQNKKDIYEKGDEGEITVSLRVQDTEGYWSDWVSKKIILYDAEDNFWFVDGEPAIPAGYYNFIDKDDSTFIQNDKNRTITWKGDISGRTMFLYLHSRSYPATNISFYDKNNKRLPFIRTSPSNGFADYYGESLQFSTYNQKISLVVPEGATKMELTNFSTYYSIQLLEEQKVNELSDIKVVENNYSITVTYNRPTGVNSVYLIDTESNQYVKGEGEALTLHSLEPDKKHNLVLVGVNSNFIKTKTHFIEAKTTAPEVMFYGVGINALDDDENSYESGVGNNITWNKDISNKIITMSVYSGRVTSAARIEFYDENDTLLNVYSNTIGYNNYVGFNSSKVTVHIIVPEGAVRMKTNVERIFSIIVKNSSVKELVPITITNQINYTSSFRLNLTKPSGVKYLYAEDLDTGVFYTSTNDYINIQKPVSGKTYRFKIGGVDTNLNYTKPIYIEATYP